MSRWNTLQPMLPRCAVRDANAMHPVHHGFRFEAVGIAPAAIGAPVGLSLEDVGPLDLHGLVDENPAGVGHSVGSVFGQ